MQFTFARACVFTVAWTRRMAQLHRATAPWFPVIDRRHQGRLFL